MAKAISRAPRVALREEVVDRNYDVEFDPYNTGKVTLLTEGVDRN